MALFKKFFHTYEHQLDRPDSTLDRGWRWWITFSAKPALTVSLEWQMIRWKGEPCKPHMVMNYMLQFFWRPSTWRIESFHAYYDGQHCFWQFGPLGCGTIRGRSNCKKCWRDANE